MIRKKLIIAILIMCFAGCKKFHPLRTSPDESITALRSSIVRVAGENHPSVRLDIVVEGLNSQGSYEMLRDFQKGNFTITENGGPVILETISPNRLLPYAAVIVLDRSGSMIDAYPYLNDAVVGFINDLESSDQRISIIHFGSTVTVPTPFSSDKASLIQEVNSHGADMGMTALWEAVGTALEKIQEITGGYRQVIVMTDGGNNGNHDIYTDVNAVIRYALDIGQAVDCVGFADFTQDLYALAEQTNGVFFHANTSADFAYAYDSLAPTKDWISLYYRSRESGSKNVTVYINYGPLSSSCSGSY